MGSPREVGFAEVCSRMRIYPVGIVGKSAYQDAIGRTHAGEPVKIFHEPDNPHDELALVVENNLGEPIGYIPRASWLRRCIHEDGRGCAATVKSIEAPTDGVKGVVIDVTVTDDEVFERSYMARRAPDRNKKGLFDGIKNVLRRI